MENTTELTKTVYDKLSSFYDKMFFVLIPGHKKAARYLSEQGIKHVLEVGMGTGLTLRHYSPGTHVIGVDMSDGMLNEARQKRHLYPGIDVEFHQMNAQSMDFADNSFECTYAPSLMTVVPDPQALLKEMIRVTKVGGKIIIISHFQLDRLRDGVWSKVAAPFTKKFFGFRMDLKLEIFKKQKGIKILETQKVNPVGPYYLSHMVILEKTEN